MLRFDLIAEAPYVNQHIYLPPPKPCEVKLPSTCSESQQNYRIRLCSREIVDSQINQGSFPSDEMLGLRNCNRL